MPSLTVLNIQKLSIFSRWSRRPACRPPPPAHPPLCTCQIVVSCHLTGTGDHWANLFFSWGSVRCIWGTAVPAHLFEIWCSQLPHLLLQFSPWFLRRRGLVDLWVCVVVCVCGTTTKEIANLHHTHRILFVSQQLVNCQLRRKKHKPHPASSNTSITWIPNFVFQTSPFL